MAFHNASALPVRRRDTAFICKVSAIFYYLFRWYALVFNAPYTLRQFQPADAVIAFHLYTPVKDDVISSGLNKRDVLLCCGFCK